MTIMIYGYCLSDLVYTTITIVIFGYCPFLTLLHHHDDCDLWVLSSADSDHYDDFDL